MTIPIFWCQKMHQLDVFYILSNKDFDQDRYAVLIFLYTQDWELMVVHKNFSIYSRNCTADLFLWLFRIFAWLSLPSYLY